MPISPIYYACFLKKFNNYFNRIIKGYETLAEYQTAAADYFLYDKPINYNPYDNVSTELIMNDCDFDPDYVLILNSELSIVARWFVLESVFTREKQRKFTLRRDVIYDNKEALKQSPIFIQKAMLEDTDPFILNSEGMSFNEIKTSETLLKDKSGVAWIVGYIAKNTSPATATAPAGEGTIVNYLDFSTLASEVGVSVDKLAAATNFDGSDTVKSFFATKNTIVYGAGPAASTNVPFTNVRWTIGMNSDFSAYISEQNTTVPSWAKPLLVGTLYITEGLTYSSNLASALIANKAALVSAMENNVLNMPYFTEPMLNKLVAREGAIIKYNNKYYQLHTATGGAVSHASGYHVYTYYGAFSTCFVSALTGLTSTLAADGEYQITSSGKNVSIVLTELTPEALFPSVQTKISSSRVGVEEQAFDMFAIPYGEATIETTSLASGDFSSDLYAIRKIISALVLQLNADLYDIQLLPYCPRQDTLLSPRVAGHINIKDLTEDKDFNYIKTINIPNDHEELGNNVKPSPQPDDHQYVRARVIIQNETTTDVLYDTYSIQLGSDLVSNESYSKTQSGTDVLLELYFDIPNGHSLDEVEVMFYWRIMEDKNSGIILWCDSASFSLSLDYQLTMTEGAKIESQCNKYRLCSPNYQGSFDFNLARNGGAVNYFLAECTYKPYTPYIKVAPEFNYLYGVNFGDARGLICGGDYSIPRFTSEWETYQLNNKNYQNIFNREIQNLDFEQSLAMRYQLIGGSVEILNAGAKGAGTGAFLGGGWGALAGGIAGTALSAAGMAADVDLLGKKQREQKSLAIDKFNYQLGNIKALPYTLTKVGAFDINSKIFPFLEYYTCTPEEKEALQSKIQYESMTVMRIGLVGTYFGAFSEPRYFKGELIRNEVIAEDNHIFEALYAELLKGVYF